MDFPNAIMDQVCGVAGSAPAPLSAITGDSAELEPALAYLRQHGWITITDDGMVSLTGGGERYRDAMRVPATGEPRPAEPAIDVETWNRVAGEVERLGKWTVGAAGVVEPPTE